jgi:multiple sugar transport system permease protein
MKEISLSQKPVSLGLEKMLVYLFLIFLTVLCVIPFVIMLINASRQSSEIVKGFSFIPGSSFMDNLRNLLKDENIPVVRGLFNSVFISGCCAILCTYFSAMTAYGIFTYNFKGKKFAFNFIMVVMMVPTQVSALGFIRLMMKMNLMDTFFPLIIPAIAAPVVFFFMMQYMQSVLPLEIVESARVDGANEFLTFNRIVVPILKPAVALQAIFAFVANWNNYFMPALIINSKENKTIPILIAQLRSADYMKFDMGKVYMLIVVAIIPLVIVYLILSRYIIRGVTMGSVKG